MLGEFFSDFGIDKKVVNYQRTKIRMTWDLTR